MREKVVQVKRTLVISLLIAATYSLALGQFQGKRKFRESQAAPVSRVERELIAAENEQIDAVKRHDVNELRRILADEFTLVGSRSSGERTHKDQYIENSFQNRVASFSFTDFFIRVYGSTAVVNCRFSIQGLLRGKDTARDYLFTDVWVRRGGRWQLVARHSSLIRI